MKISNIQVNSGMRTSAFSFKRNSRYSKYTVAGYIPEQQEVKRPNNQQSTSSKTMRIASLATAAGLLIGGGLGASYGANQAAKKNESRYFVPSGTRIVANSTATETPNFTPSPTELIMTSYSKTPESVYRLANGATFTEINLDNEPFLYNSKATIPSYMKKAGINKEVLATAQRNTARIYRTNQNKDSYIIICPKQDITAGELKAIFGIADGVLGKDELNNIQGRELSEENGNFDSAIIPANDAIRVLRFNGSDHPVGNYTIHNSNRSRNKITNAILDAANQ